MMPPSSPRAILFDWDNTLVDTWPCLIKAFTATQTAMGHRAWTDDECRARIARSMRETFPEMFGDRWEEAGTIFLDTFAATHIAMLETLPGAAALLDDLAGQGIYLAVVSNKTGPFLRAEAEHLGWTRYFGRLVGAGDAARDKPARDPVDMALAGAGVEAGPEVWFVGDSPVDMQCAVATGCRPVLMHPRAPEAALFPDCRPAEHVVDCRALATRLRMLAVPITPIR
jgi:phosphoglycolate phosphatase